MVYCISGRVDIGIREIIDFVFFDAVELFSEVFTRVITRLWEGFMLKDCDEPYFLFNRIKLFIKLKKDYIAGLGDAVDFIIISGRRDTRDEQEFGIGKL